MTTFQKAKLLSAGNTSIAGCGFLERCRNSCMSRWRARLVIASFPPAALAGAASFDASELSARDTFRDLRRASLSFLQCAVNEERREGGRTDSQRTDRRLSSEGCRRVGATPKPTSSSLAFLPSFDSIFSMTCHSVHRHVAVKYMHRVLETRLVLSPSRIVFDN